MVIINIFVIAGITWFKSKTSGDQLAADYFLLMTNTSLSAIL
ncbi:hypothetical protein NP439_04605 [Oceanobacillus jeddahense]|uniref:Uncharacterized protein n=1 Tax=Oceanobacillus jeddahense TaxID=1462527 RepID=A0ABY5JW30_9BACI|nr:hypothetical protein [Oceanobacillus jeddahense]UUI03979.1 hypothetical protein NP439_04605 [Oceanobacillus jeddahense]